MGFSWLLLKIEQRSLSLLRESGIFPTLAKILKGNPRCAVKAAHVLSEIAKNEEMKKPCIEANLVPTLIPLLESTDQEMLLHAGRAIGRICYDNRDLQEQLVKVGVITSLVRILTDYAESEPLVHVDLLALCNLADLDTAKEALSKTKVAEQLVKQLRRAENHERLEMVFEVLQALAENDALKVQLVEAGVQEVLSEILLRLQGSSQAEDTCIVKAASDLIVSLLLGGMCRRFLLAKGCGIISQNAGTCITSKHTQLQRQDKWLLLILQKMMATAYEWYSWESYISFWIFWRNM
ncbi:rap1 GTPase-GDP dissociation stimulator 1-like [Columba livia]|uniref:Rap1 GTPase-GDP dissociation stimulator 1-like n=1 Tax=Columba livia TaxID=8932 RepID=A0A2I0MFC4_COLLI|nr:rap1 GTPase-GDP dissociation stimulator 1-like [Columba livia]